MIRKTQPRVIVIGGPTGTGKSDLALEAAEIFGGEIINADSVQVFKGVDIGTAKVPASARKKVPHHLLDHIPVGGSYTAGEFRKDVLNLISTRTQKSVSTFYVVGGSGFYIQALLKGMFPVPPSNPAVKAKLLEELEEKGLEALFIELKERDSISATKIGPNDQYRILRALEILRTTQGSTLQEIRSQFKTQEPPFLYSFLALERRRVILRRDLEKRAARMIQDGLVEEVQSFVKKGYQNWGPLQSVGYKETLAFLNGEIETTEQLVEAIANSSMKLAKKQSTWFHRDAEVHWFDPDFSRHAPIAHIEEFLETPCAPK